MQNKTITALLTTIAISIAAVSCEKETENINLKKIANHSFTPGATREFVIQERDPHHPLTNYHEIASGYAKTKADPGLDSYLGYSLKVKDYPLESPENIGFPVLDLNKFKEDHPSYFTNVPVKKSASEYVAFYGFDRYEKNMKDSEKVNGGFNLSVPVFTLGAKASYKKIWQRNESSIDEHVYGEYTNSFLDRKYAILLNTNGGGHMDYILDDFTRFLYYGTPPEIINNYGCFVLSQYITGAQASILYKGDYKEKTLTESEDIEHEFELTISKTINEKESVGGDAGFTINNSNSFSSSKKFSNVEVSARTIGGIPLFSSFSSPKDINSVNYDFSSWCNSLSNQANLTIANYPENSLIPITEFIEESNIRNIINYHLEYNHSSFYKPLDQFCEPYISVWFDSNIYKSTLTASISINTRYNEKYVINKDEIAGYDILPYLNKVQNTFPHLKVTTNAYIFPLSSKDKKLYFSVEDQGGVVYSIIYHPEYSEVLSFAFVNKNPSDYVKACSAWLKKLYPGIKVVELFNDDYYPLTGATEFDEEVLLDNPVAFSLDFTKPNKIIKLDTVFKDSKLFIDNKTGKTYILTTGEQNEKIAYTLYGKDIISDYCLEEIINKIPLANNVTLRQIRKNYKLIAL